MKLTLAVASTLAATAAGQRFQPREPAQDGQSCGGMMGTMCVAGPRQHHRGTQEMTQPRLTDLHPLSLGASPGSTASTPWAR